MKFDIACIKHFCITSSKKNSSFAYIRKYVNNSNGNIGLCTNKHHRCIVCLTRDTSLHI